MSQEATESSVRFGSVRWFGVFSAVRFGSVENFDRTTEFFVLSHHFQCNFFKHFSQTFRMILNTLIDAFDDFLEKYLDRKNLMWFGSVRLQKFGSVR